MIGLADFSHVAAFQEEMLEEAHAKGKKHSKPSKVVWKTLVALEKFADCVLNDKKDEQAPLIDAIKAYRRYKKLPASGDEEEIDRLIFAKEEKKASASATAQQVDTVLLEAYRQEAADHLQVILDVLTQNDEPDVEELQEIRRAVHSIKGGAGTIGFQEAADLAHTIEDLLERIAAEDASLLADSREVIVRAVDALGSIVEDDETPADLDEIKSQLAAASDRFASASDKAPKVEKTPAEVESETKARNEAVAKEALEAIEADQKNPVSGELLEVYVEEAEDHIKLIYNCLLYTSDAADE